MIGRTLLHYTITSELGAGAMGRVYLARDIHTERRVALKFLGAALVTDPESRERLVREARAASRLSHPGIVTLYGLEEADGELFLIEEYVEGETLAQRLARGSMGPEEVLRLARELSAALAHAHAHGVVHRDLKPDNVLIGPDAHYKIADFGIAHVEGMTTLTAAGTLLGTLPYLAPERLRGGRGDTRADLYALGAILYEAMSGRRAIEGASEAEALYQVMNEVPAPLEPATPTLRPLAMLVGRLLAKEPRERPESAKVVLASIEEQTSPPNRPVSASRRPAWRWVGVAAALSLLAGAGLLFAWRRAHPVAPTEGASALAVLYFENVGDPADRERVGPITSNLLITSLAQAEALHVLSTQRILDALVGIGQKTGVVDRKVALQVARKLRAGRIVTGSILQSAPTLVMTAEVSDVRSGEVLAATRVEGEPGQTVFQVVDALSARLLAAMEPGRPKALEPVAQRASADVVAMKRYVEGLEQLSLGDPQAAVTSLEEAVRRDPGFAQAHYHLAIARWWTDGGWEGAMASLQGARASADRLSPWEREIVEGLGLLMTRRFDSALRHFTRLTRLHPDDKLPLYGLMEAYYHSGQFEQATVAARRVLAIDPRFSPAADHLTDALMATGKWEEAESEIETLLRANRDDLTLSDRLWQVRIWRGDGKGALSAIRHAYRVIPAFTIRGGRMLLAWDSLAAARVMITSGDASSPEVENSRARFYDLALALHQGKFRAAESIARETLGRIHERPRISADAMVAVTYDLAIAAAIHAGDARQALEWADSAVVRERTALATSNEDHLIMTRIRVGRIPEAVAMMRSLESLPEASDKDARVLMNFFRGLAESGQGHWPLAVERFRQAMATGYGINWRPYLVRALLGANNPGALALIDTLLSAPSAFSPDENVRLFLYRGQALERLNRPAEAAQSYHRFLDIWRKADPGTPEVEQAQVALARLERPDRGATVPQP